MFNFEVRDRDEETEKRWRRVWDDDLTEEDDDDTDASAERKGRSLWEAEMEAMAIREARREAQATR